MTRYLISFDAHAMDHIADEDMPAVAELRTRWFMRPWTPGCGCSAADWKTRKRASWPPTDGRRRPVPAGHRRTFCHRRALTRGGAEVGCQDRRRLPLCSRGPRVHARPGRRQLDDTRLGECSVMTPERRLLRTAVAEVDDAVAECARLEELKVDTSVVCEEGFASAESHGVDEQVVLVDELVRCESRGRSAPPTAIGPPSSSLSA